MFAQTFCDSPLELSRRKWTTLLSFSLEALAVIALITAPLLRMDTLPQSRTIAAVFTPILPAEPVANPAPARGAAAAAPLGQLDSRRLMTPGWVPSTIPTSDGPPVQPPGVPWGRPGANPLGVIVGNGAEVRPVLPTPARPTRVSGGVMEGALIQKIQPVYPRLALVTRTEGSVVLQAVISREGVIENLQVISGSPYLSRAAVEAVHQWRYRPYRLNGEPVEVETQIVVNFTLGGN